MEKNGKQERELTAKESLISMAGVGVVFIIAAVGDNDFSTTAFVRLAVAIAVGAGICVWQYWRLNRKG